MSLGRQPFPSCILSGAASAPRFLGMRETIALPKAVTDATRSASPSYWRRDYRQWNAATAGVAYQPVEKRNSDILSERTPTETDGLEVRPTVFQQAVIPHAVSSDTFGPHAIGVGVINAVPTLAPTPMAWGLNVKRQFLDCRRVRVARTRSPFRRTIVVPAPGARRQRLPNPDGVSSRHGRQDLRTFSDPPSRREPRQSP